MPINARSGGYELDERSRCIWQEGEEGTLREDVSVAEDESREPFVPPIDPNFPHPAVAFLHPPRPALFGGSPV